MFPPLALLIGRWLAAFDDALVRVEEKLAFDLFRLGGVAFVAVLGQNRADVFFKKFHAFPGDRFGPARANAHGHNEPEKENVKPTAHQRIISP